MSLNNDANVRPCRAGFWKLVPKIFPTRFPADILVLENFVDQLPKSSPFGPFQTMLTSASAFNKASVMLDADAVTDIV